MQAEIKCKIGMVRHQYTHFKIRLHVFLFHPINEKPPLTVDSETWGWFTREQIKSLALSKADRKVLELAEKNDAFV